MYSWIITVWFLQSCLSIASSALPPYITTHPEGDTTVEGNTEPLNCNAVGDPPLDYLWLKDDLALGPYNPEQKTLVLRDIGRDDAGEYRCLVRNPIGTIMSNRALLNVAYLDSFAGGDTTVSATAGQAIILSCPSINSYPSPTITWRISGVDVVNSDNKILTSDQRLAVLDSSSLDQGVYTCRADNANTGDYEISPLVSLNVQGTSPSTVEPSIVVAPSHTVVVLGETIAKMECIVNARPLESVQMTWKRDGTVLQIGGKELFELYILAPTLSDEGVYACEATMVGYPTVTAMANLTFYSFPTSVTSPDEISSVGSDVMLPCEVTGNSQPTVTWFQNTVDVSSLRDGRFQVLPSGTLQITYTEAFDAGMYQCMASNEAGEDISDTWLQVLEIAPTFTSRPNDTTVIEGQAAVISCQAGGAPRPTISWLKDGSIPVDSSLILESGDLSITQTRYNQTGDYTCTADNGVGSINATVRLTVYLPTFIETPPQDSKVQLSLPVVMTCEVSHDPVVNVNIEWLLDSAPVDISSSRVNKLPTGSLEITQAIRTDKGLYECVVTSVAGNDRGSATLTILELPQKPTNVVAVISSSDSRTIDLTWLEPFDGNSPLLRYIIEQKEDESSYGEIDSNVDPSLPTFHMTAAVPSRSYRFRVTAENRLGRSEPSEPTVVLSIPEEPPDVAPDNVVTSASSTTAIIVEWQAPPEDTWNGALQGYILRYKLYGYTMLSYTEVNITSVRQTSYTLSDLITWTRYEIQVAAYNGAGVGTYCNSLEQRTNEGVPTEAPVNVQTVVESSTSISFQWEAPDPQSINGINQGYKLQAWEAGSESAMTVVVVPPDPTNAVQRGTIEGLRKYTQYLTSVLCFTSPGDGPPSPVMTVKTHQDVPGPVESLTLDEVLDTSLKVRWAEPSETNGVLTGYDIYWVERNASVTPPIQPISLQPEETMFQVTGLLATTEYKLTMWALTAVGQGPPTEIVFSSGVPPLLPDPPAQLAVSNIQSRTVNLQFQPGFSGHTSISTWIVEAQIGVAPTWLRLYDHHDPDSKGFVVPDLIPYMDYSFRLRAENVVGESAPSQSTRKIQTLQDIPEIAPPEVTLRVVSETSLRVRWVPLLDSQWSGEPLGYHIYWQVVDPSTPDPVPMTYDLTDPYMGEYIIAGLEEWVEYTVQVDAFNEIGAGPISDSLVERTSDTVPSSGPTNVAASATSASSITVTWGPVPLMDQNGAILGYKVLYRSNSSEQQSLDVPGENTSTALVASLRGFTQYSLVVVAYTRMGDGVPSGSVEVQTLESVPGPPTGILFPLVTDTSIKIIWDAPLDPNGIVDNYRVSYVQLDIPVGSIETTEVGLTKEFSLTDLLTNAYYTFNVTARTRLGWGQEASALVYTTADRVAPSAPSQPIIDYIQSRQVRISWIPGSDGNGPLRAYSIQLKQAGGTYQDCATNVDASAISYEVYQLSPYTEYQFRLRAHNDVGASPYSPDSQVISTDLDVPDGEPVISEVTPTTPTSVRVVWTPPPSNTLNGPLLGYRVSYRILPDSNPVERSTSDPGQLQYNLTSLTKYEDYEVTVRAYNAKGEGPASLPLSVYVGVAVPSAAPSNVAASEASSSSLLVSWDAIPLDSHNGGLQGYKIVYWETGSDGSTQRTRTFPSQDTAATLESLYCYTNYTLTVVGFNSAGDGPWSPAATAVTALDVPGVPSSLGFTQIRMSSLNVTWSPPELPCGVISGYQVYYESITSIDGEISTITVEINEPILMYHVAKLGEFSRYTFRVRARTDEKNYGAMREAEVTTGPQTGAPDTPESLLLTPMSEYLMLSWSAPVGTGSSELTGYIAETQEEGRPEWEVITDTVGPDALSYNVPYGVLKASTNYKFRLMAENNYSISFPKATQSFYFTPATGSLSGKMFYEEWWFLVIVGLVGVIVLILITATLCMLGKGRLYKERKTHRPVNQEEAVNVDDEGFSAAFEMQQNSATNGRANGRGGGSKSGPYGRTNSYTRPPPRPSPGNVLYSEEEESKHYESVHRQIPLEHEETSSLTDKADLQSRSDSQSSYDSKGSESDIEFHEDPSSFANHYASVPVYPSHSWRRQKGPKAYSYTDSESDMHSVPVNGLAGMPAGSRAPLHGFSSFV